MPFKISHHLVFVSFLLLLNYQKLIRQRNPLGYRVNPHICGPGAYVQYIHVWLKNILFARYDP